MPKLVPDLQDFGPLYVQPHFFGDAYTKKTGLWGQFNPDMPRNDVEPIRACDAGSWLMQLGGSSEKTKALRSVTPAGFAAAFFAANQWNDGQVKIRWPFHDEMEDEGETLPSYIADDAADGYDPWN